MANAWSRLQSALETWSFKYNCYEAVHPWTPYCSASALDVGFTVFTQAIKLYTPLYLFSQLARRKFDLASFVATSQSIVRSTSFISANAFFVLLFFCSSQYLTQGKFYYYAVAYLPGFLASAMAVLIEKPNRRSSLAFYVANVASEALFRISVARGYVRPVKHGQVYLFSLAMATIMFLAKKHGFEDDPLSTAIKLIVGAEEARAKRRAKGALKEQLPGVEEGAPENESTLLVSKASEKSFNQLSRAKRALGWLKQLFFGRHPLCPHSAECSCFYYVARASSRAFFIGSTAQLSLRLASKAPLIWREPSLIKQIVADSGLLRFGLFLSAFSGLYKAGCCSLRRATNKCTPTQCFAAALVAGPALLVYPSPTVALYVLWKCLEALYHEAVRSEVIKNKELFIVVLYGLATSQIFYSALMDPRYMKKSYMAFLDRVSNHRMHQVNRSLLDLFGTEASSGYEDFFPDLHPRFMSDAFLGSCWIWMIEQKFVANQLSA